MTKMQELLAQRDAIQRQIDEEARLGRTEGLKKIREIALEYSLSPDDIAKALASRKSPSTAGSKVVPKFRNPQSGETWSGRGLKPKWLVKALEGGAKLQEFSIEDASTTSKPPAAAPGPAPAQAPAKKAAAKKVARKKA